MKSFEEDLERFDQQHLFSDPVVFLEALRELESKLSDETPDAVRILYWGYVLEALVVASELKEADRLYERLTKKNLGQLDDSSLSFIHKSFSVYHSHKGNINAMKEAAEKALAYAENAKDDEYIILARIQLGQAYAHLYQLDQALNHLLAANDMSLNAKSSWIKQRQTQIFELLGGVYSQMYEFDKAIEHYMSILPTLEKHKDEKRLAVLYYNIASAYRQKDSYELAKKYLSKSLALGNKIGDKAHIAYVTYGQAMVHYMIKEVQPAIESARLARKLFEELNNKEMEFYTGMQLALAYWDNQQLDLAAEHFLAALELIKELGIAGRDRDVAFYLTELYKDKGDFEKALYYSRLELKLVNENYDREKETLKQSLKTSYEEKQAELKTKEIIKENAIQKIELENKDKIIATQKNSLAVMLLLVVMLLALTLRSTFLGRKLKKHTRYDTTSGLINRRFGLKKGAALFSKCQRYQDELSLAIVAIDNFTEFRKSMDQEILESVVEAFATCLKEVTRSGDILARYNDDEFLLVLPHTSRDEVKQVLENIKQVISAFDWPSVIDEKIMPAISVCCGFSTFRDGTHNFSQLEQNAASALIKAKEQGADMIVAYDGGRDGKIEFNPSS